MGHVVDMGMSTLEHLHPHTGNKARKSSFEGQCFPYWAYVVEAVPPLPGEFVGSLVAGCSMRESRLESDISDEHGGTWRYGTGHERKGTWLEEGVGAVARSTMSEWREIEKILAKLGHATTTLVRKNDIPGRAFGMLRAGGGHQWTSKNSQGDPRASIWGCGGDALST